MDFELLYRPTQTIARCRLAAGEELLAESGAMIAMSQSIQLETQSGGAGSALKRLFGGESFFRNRFRARAEGEVLLAPPLRGDMVVLDVGPEQYLVQQGAFVGSSPTVDVKTRASARGFFSGMGIFLLETSGRGQLLANAFGGAGADRSGRRADRGHGPRGGLDLHARAHHHQGQQRLDQVVLLGRGSGGELPRSRAGVGPDAQLE
jgi:uncharacterized protein (TIGR00266 family)